MSERKDKPLHERIERAVKNEDREQRTNVTKRLDRKKNFTRGRRVP